MTSSHDLARSGRRARIRRERLVEAELLADGYHLDAIERPALLDELLAELCDALQKGTS